MKRRTGWLPPLLVLLLGPGVVDLGAQSVGAPPSPAAITDVSPSAEPGPTVVDGADQVWYLGRQLRQPVVIAVPAESEADCMRHRVTFRAAGDGQVSPASAQAAWVWGRCEAESWWRLGETVGVQHLSAAVEGEAEVVVRAVARQGARIFFGGAWTPSEDAWTELVTTGEAAPYLKERAGGSVFRPVIGVDFALWPSWRQVRVGVGASAREIDRHFYFGLSVLQGLVFGPGQEGSAVDVHMGLQLSRRDIGRTGASCAPATFCTERDLRFSGLTFMVTIDGASAFRGLAGSVLR
ncbi:hypothetical protein WI372_07465 [Gemmatimonadota bacterium DH-20]|uniref:Uncharacterized protein n=1 Tax=Gaopeijia maritima TaxID=3119007 RepID=A0ABU9EB79_9BACT